MIAYLSRKIIGARLRLTKFLYSLPEIELESLIGRDGECAEPILEKSCMPPYFVYDHDDFHPLQKLARYLDPKVIVELGTAHGNTTANLARNCERAKIFTVNAPVEKMTGVITTFDLTEEEIGCVYRNHGYSDQVVQIFENTLNLDLSSHLKPGELDFGVIDACHDFEYVINDFEKLLPFVAENGVVMFHDIHPSMDGHLKVSYMAAMELKKRGYDLRHIRGTFWGIWCKNWQKRFAQS